MTHLTQILTQILTLESHHTLHSSQICGCPCPLHHQRGSKWLLLLQVGLNLAGGSSLLPYTNTTKQILVAAFRKSVNDNGQVQLLSVQVSIVPFAIYLLLQTTMTGHILYGLFAFLTTEQRTLLL